MTSLLPVVSNSEMEDFRRCPRLHFYKYGIRRRPLVSAEALVLGTLIHSGLEAWFKSLLSPNGVSPIDWAVGGIGRAAKWTKADPLSVVQAEELLLGYHCRWVDDPLEVLAVEQWFECDARDPVLGSVVGRLKGKIDAIVRYRGDVHLVEHKSTSYDFSPGSHYWERTRLSSQLGLYFVGARSLGYQPAGTIYDVLGKPRDHEPARATPPEKRRYRKDGGIYKGQAEVDEDPETYRLRLRSGIQQDPGAFYARQIVVRLAPELDAAVSDLAATVAMMGITSEIGAHPRNVDSCWDFARRCEYFGCCTGEESIEDDHKFRTAKSSGG